MNNNKSLIALPFIVIALATLIWIVLEQFNSASTDNQAAKAAYVYTICNNSRQQLSGASEAACGDAQDTTNTEFLCNANNTSPTTYCWVEAK